MKDFVWALVSDRRFFPTVLIALDFCAAARWGCEPGEWRRVIYWAAAGVLTAAVTW
jgi:hypothetical protein